MQDIIKKIIEIDHMAQKMTDESIELKKEAEISIENDKKLLREKYIQKARNRIQVNTETEDSFLRDTLKEITSKSDEIDLKMRNIYTENKGKWIDEIYNRVIGR